LGRQFFSRFIRRTIPILQDSFSAALPSVPYSLLSITLPFLFSFFLLLRVLSCQLRLIPFFPAVYIVHSLFGSIDIVRKEICL
jgi:hypothetical protein